MEEVFSNPGFYHISQKILQNLDEESIMVLGKTNKIVLDMCHTYLVRKPSRRKSLDVEYSKDQLYLIDPNLKIKDFFIFIKDNEIYHETYFKYHFLERSSQESRKILETFLEKLVDMLNVLKERMFLKEEQFLNQRDTLEWIIYSYIEFIPSNCPLTSKKSLIELLSFALAQNKLMKILLAATKEMDTCMRMIFLALTSPSWPGQQR